MIAFFKDGLFTFSGEYFDSWYPSSLESKHCGMTLGQILCSTPSGLLKSPLIWQMNKITTGITQIEITLTLIAGPSHPTWDVIKIYVNSE